MEGNKNIIGIQGPAGVGKTSVSRKLCEKLPGRTVHISMDVLRHMTRLSPASQEESDRYILMAKESVVDLFKFYLRKEVDNIIVEFSPPMNTDRGETDKEVVREIKELGGKMFLLQAGIEEVLKRNRERTDTFGKWGKASLSDELVKELYCHCGEYADQEDFKVIETDKIGLDETVLIIMRLI